MAVQTKLIVLGSVESTLERARGVIATYGLRAADAIQLAAAIAARDFDRTLPIVSLDHELRTAALAEGFTVLPESAPGELSLP
jgi:predicted nucleic acid-binding protein